MSISQFPEVAFTLISSVALAVPSTLLDLPLATANLFATSNLSRPDAIFILYSNMAHRKCTARATAANTIPLGKRREFGKGPDLATADPRPDTAPETVKPHDNEVVPKDTRKAVKPPPPPLPPPAGTPPPENLPKAPREPRQPPLQKTPKAPHQPPRQKAPMAVVPPPENLPKAPREPRQPPLQKTPSSLHRPPLQKTPREVVPPPPPPPSGPPPLENLLEGRRLRGLRGGGRHMPTEIRRYHASPEAAEYNTPPAPQVLGKRRPSPLEGSEVVCTSPAQKRICRPDKDSGVAAVPDIPTPDITTTLQKSEPVKEPRQEPTPSSSSGSVQKEAIVSEKNQHTKGTQAIKEPTADRKGSGSLPEAFNTDLRGRRRRGSRADTYVPPRMPKRRRSPWPRRDFKQDPYSQDHHCHGDYGSGHVGRGDDTYIPRYHEEDRYNGERCRGTYDHRRDEYRRYDDEYGHYRGPRRFDDYHHFGETYYESAAMRAGFATRRDNYDEQSGRDRYTPDHGRYPPHYGDKWNGHGPSPGYHSALYKPYSYEKGEPSVYDYRDGRHLARH